MTDLQRWLMVFALAGGTILTRFTPFLFFPENKPIPHWLRKLGDTLPLASLGMLVVYALKGISPMVYPYGIPELISLVSITFIHLWKKNTLVSIFIGLVIYLILVNLIFT